MRRRARTGCAGPARARGGSVSARTSRAHADGDVRARTQRPLSQENVPAHPVLAHRRLRRRTFVGGRTSPAAASTRAVRPSCDDESRSATARVLRQLALDVGAARRAAAGHARREHANDVRGDILLAKRAPAPARSSTPSCARRRPRGRRRRCARAGPAHVIRVLPPRTRGPLHAPRRRRTARCNAGRRTLALVVWGPRATHR